jgi:hypothetical protein
MMTPTRIVRLIGIMGLVGWLGMVGWMVKTSQAQNGGQAPSPALPGPKQEIAGKESLPPPPIAPLASPAPAPPAIEPLSLPTEKAPSMPLPIARAEGANSQDGVTPGHEDPEKAAQSFVERNQKEAEANLKALTTEAEQLRARLAKLDSGIKKWQNLLTALKAAQQGQPLATAEEPGNLEPIAAGTSGPRNDKRVKWASATSGAAGSSPQPAPANEPPPVTPAPAPAVSQPTAAPAQVVVPAAAPR